MGDNPDADFEIDKKEMDDTNDIEVIEDTGLSEAKESMDDTNDIEVIEDTGEASGSKEEKSKPKEKKKKQTPNDDNWLSELSD